MIPVRCFSCGRVVAADYERFKERVARGEKPKDVLDALGVARYCCRRMIVTQSDIIDDAAPYA
ncbi:MAG TPA: DNA-directed RNA polymerase subunit N [Candidatus Thermoplasmatota archaeon]|nr:DNA-directed RNA polymerase subunit N [Candidatus Thermoplasmatota archaeon]